MAAAKKNKYRSTLKTPELRQEAYRQYCDHLAQGFTKKSWYFQHPTCSLTWESMEKYIAEYQDLDPVHKEVAWAKGYQKWERVVADSATGENKDANTASLQMVMRNKYGWDREQSSERGSTQPLIKSLAEAWRKA